MATGTSANSNTTGPPTEMRLSFLLGSDSPVTVSRATWATPPKLRGKGSPRSSTGIFANSTNTNATSAIAAAMITAQSPGREVLSPRKPFDGGAACGLGAAARPEPPERVEPDEDEAVVLAVTAFSRRAASASRLARLRAARRCLESWRLSGTVATVGPPEDRGRPGGPSRRLNGNPGYGRRP
jgi:hypothetical protein